jgi:hypothetical protein
VQCRIASAENVKLAGCILGGSRSRIQKHCVLRVTGGEDARDLASGVEVTEHVILTYFINNSVQEKVSSNCKLCYYDGRRLTSFLTLFIAFLTSFTASCKAENITHV